MECLCVASVFMEYYCVAREMPITLQTAQLVIHHNHWAAVDQIWKELCLIELMASKV